MRIGGEDRYRRLVVIIFNPDLLFRSVGEDIKRSTLKQHWQRAGRIARRKDDSVLLDTVAGGNRQIPFLKKRRILREDPEGWQRRCKQSREVFHISADYSRSRTLKQTHSVRHLPSSAPVFRLPILAVRPAFGLAFPFSLAVEF
jgi:hypothetical protein